MLSPLMTIIGTLFAFSISILLYLNFSLNYYYYFFAPVFLLILFHTAVNQITNKTSRPRNDWALVIKKSLGKYIFWLLVIYLVVWIYTHHSFYIDFAPNTVQMLIFFKKIYWVAGLPYFIFIERYKTGPFEWLNDPYLKVLSFLWTLYKRDWKSLKYRLFKSGYRTVILTWLIRFHYMPVMVEQVFWGTQRVVGHLKQPDPVLTNEAFLVGLLFLIDAINASIGYFWESSLTGTRFRAVDTNAIHWIVAPMCYMPFIEYASDFIPFPEGAGGVLLMSHPLFETGVNILTIISMIGLVLCTTCLGFSYSNLCYKKIQTRGPYAIVRHPGTVFKMSFFFLTTFRYAASWTLTLIGCYIFWMGIYVARLLCEERFLKRFREYREYMEVTRYRLIPGVW